MIINDAGPERRKEYLNNETAKNMIRNLSESYLEPIIREIEDRIKRSEGAVEITNNIKSLPYSYKQKLIKHFRDLGFEVEECSGDMREPSYNVYVRVVF